MTSRPPLLQIEALSKRFGANHVLDRVDLRLEAGQVMAVIGASGSGKSTMLRCINALEEYEAGYIWLNATRLSYTGDEGARRRVSDRHLSAERAKIGMVFQSYNLFPHLNARDNVMLGLRRVRGLPYAVSKDIATEWLSRVGLADRMDYFPDQLSGGQQQRVALARAFALDPQLVLLDEVTSALDPELVGEVLATIRTLAQSGMTMIVVSHELTFVRDVADVVVFMHQGRVLEAGPPPRLFASPATPELAAFIGRTGAEIPRPAYSA
jgi:polar amino acid transport system ATP-binding protein